MRALNQQTVADAATLNQLVGVAARERVARLLVAGRAHSDGAAVGTAEERHGCFVRRASSPDTRRAAPAVLPRRSAWSDRETGISAGHACSRSHGSNASGRTAATQRAGDGTMEHACCPAAGGLTCRLLGNHRGAGRSGGDLVPGCADVWSASPVPSRPVCSVSALCAFVPIRWGVVRRQGRAKAFPSLACVRRHLPLRQACHHH